MNVGMLSKYLMRMPPTQDSKPEPEPQTRIFKTQSERKRWNKVPTRNLIYFLFKLFKTIVPNDLYHSWHFCSWNWRVDLSAIEVLFCSMRQEKFDTEQEPARITSIFFSN